MDESKVSEWVEAKLEEGTDEERIRKVLSKTGHDPGIVEEVKESSEDSDRRAKSSKDLKREVSEKRQEEDVSGTQEVSNGTEKSGLKELEKELVRKQAEKAEAIGEELSEDVKKVWKPSVSLLVFLGVLVLVVASVPKTDLLQNSRDGLSDVSDNSLNKEKGVLPDDFDGEKVVLENRAANPSRAEISSGEKVAFVNRENHTLEISFDSEKEVIRIKPGKYSITSFEAITYYAAEPVQEDGRKIQGSVYVE